MGTQIGGILSSDDECGKRAAPGSRLAVLSVAYPFAPIGPRAVGGSERILSDLDRALVGAGFESLVVACSGSEVAGKLFSFEAPDGQLDDGRRESCIPRVQAAIERALAGGQVNLIHMHGLDFYRYDFPARIPALATLHLAPSFYPPWIWERNQVQFQCVSHTQRKSCPQQYPVVENGVEMLPLTEEKTGEFAIALGRICPEKNHHAALEAGTLAHTPVLLAGRVFPYAAHVDYFRQKVEPLLDRAPVRHEFLGALTREEQHRLLQRAKCLLLPTLAPETSSLVAMEALAAGTPVVAYPSGAIPEIVEDGVTGFLVSNVEEAAEAMRRISEIDPRVCRKAAESRFSRERMVADYFALYGRLAAPWLTNEGTRNEASLYGPAGSPLWELGGRG